jgi:hypothetical protein
MQAVMPHHFIAVAVAGLLVQDGRNSGRHLVGGHLVGMRKIDTRQLIAA